MIAVVGIHRSGSSCLAMVLHKLGIWMGDPLVGYERYHGGSGEDKQFSALVQRLAPFPGTERRLTWQARRDALRKWGTRHHEESYDGLVGAKHPLMCALLSEIESAWDPILISLERPLEDSIESLAKRRDVRRMGITPQQITIHQTFLWECKQWFLRVRDHLEIEYYSLLEDPDREIRRMIEYLEICPSRDQLTAALGHVRPEYRSV